MFIFTFFCSFFGGSFLHIEYKLLNREGTQVLALRVRVGLGVMTME